MAFPVVESLTPTSFGTAGTAHLVDMPATVNSGDLLLMFFVLDLSTGSETLTTPSGWTQIANTVTNTSESRFAIYYKLASGSEDGSTVDVVSSASLEAAAQVYRITGHSSTFVPAVSTVALVSPANPPLLHPGWAIADTLWLAAYGADGSNDPTTYPTNYTNGTYTEPDVAALSSMATARRAVNQEEENPSGFGAIGGEAAATFLVAVAPSGATADTVPPSFFGAGAAAETQTDGANISPALPSGWQADDIVFCLVATNANNAPTISAGWTEISTFAQANAAQSTKLWWRRMVGGDSGPTVTDGGTTALSSTNGMFSRCYGWRGCATSGTPFEDATAVGNTSAETTPDTALITTVDRDRRAVNFCAINDNVTFSSGHPPSGWLDEVADNQMFSGLDAQYCVIGKNVLAAGNVSAAVVGTMSTSETWRSLTLALIPAAVGGGSPQSVSPTGLASASTLGSAIAVPGAVGVPLSALASAAAFGSVTPLPGNRDVAMTGLASASAFGTPTMGVGGVFVPVVALASSSAFGAIVAGYLVAVSAIASASAFGTPTPSPGGTLTSVSGLASASQFGSPTPAPGNTNVPVSGIASASLIGTLTVDTDITVLVAALASASQFGTPAILVGNVLVPLMALGSQSQFGALDADGGEGPSFNPAIHGGLHRG